MKHVKHMLVAALTMFLAFVLAVPAFAHTITLSEGDTHTYNVYQVLTGTLAEEGSKQLGNPEWGLDATDAAKATDPQDFIDSLEGLENQALADAVAAVVNTDGAGRGTVSAGSPITDLPTGYYILVDKTALTGDHVNDTKALHVIKVVNDINGVTIKWDTTSDDKVITSDSLGTDNDTLDNNDIDPDGKVDNVSIGDTVNYQITAKVPANANLYNYFYFVINDTLDPGLTLNPDSIVVYKDSVAEGNELALTTDYLLKTGDAAAPKSFQVGLVDAKSLAGKDIIVTYSAVLNENAQIGEVPNKNTSTVTFSNDPNHEYNGDDENPNPGFPAQEDLDATGETPVTETETYTTGIEIQKVDENGDVLTGAEFTITGASTEIVLVSSETFAEAENGEYYGLNDGTYTKQAPVTEDYMKEAGAGATKGYVVAESDYEGTDTVEVGGTVYRPYKTGDTGTVYILVKANADQYDGKMYNKTITYTPKDTTSDVSATAEVGPDGVVRFVGLGAGEYTIAETVTPAGYNTLSDITVNIAFTANPEDGSYHWSTTSEDATYNPTTGVFEITIENNKGTELPETGGMGTTILYIVGGCMMVAGLVMYITKRRMAHIEG